MSQTSIIALAAIGAVVLTTQAPSIAQAPVATRVTIGLVVVAAAVSLLPFISTTKKKVGQSVV